MRDDYADQRAGERGGARAARVLRTVHATARRLVERAVSFAARGADIKGIDFK